MKNYLSPDDISKVENILFTDLEGTGLDFEPFTIPLEVAAIVTDGLLNEIARFGPYTIAATEDELAPMSDYVRAMHTKTGLLDKVTAPEAMPRAEVDELFAAFIAEHFPMRGHFVPARSWLNTGRVVHEDEKVGGPIIGGSSVKYDWNLIRRHMPKVFALLDYRLVDTSSFREVIRRVAPAVYDRMPNDEPPHEAMADIMLSVNELRWLTRNAVIGGSVVAEYVAPEPLDSVA